jgi:hypothetical protein
VWETDDYPAHVETTDRRFPRVNREGGTARAGKVQRSAAGGGPQRWYERVVVTLLNRFNRVYDRAKERHTGASRTVLNGAAIFFLSADANRAALAKRRDRGMIWSNDRMVDGAAEVRRGYPPAAAASERLSDGWSMWYCFNLR